MTDPNETANVATDYFAVLFAVGLCTFVCFLIYDYYQTTGELTGWMLGALVLMLFLSLGTLFGFGRLEKAIGLKDNL